MAIEARTILIEASAILAAAGIDSAKGDARLLLGIALGHDRAVLPHETLPYYSDADAARFDDLLARRCGGEPVSRIRGWREVWSLRFGLSAGTLDPRPDSEILVERAIGFAKQSVDLRLLDVGTGSGCSRSLVASGDHDDARLFTRAKRQGDSATYVLIALARIDTESEREFDGLVELHMWNLFQQCDSIGDRVEILAIDLC